MSQPLRRPEPYDEIAFTGDARRALLDRDITVECVMYTLHQGMVLRIYPETVPVARLLLAWVDQEAMLGTYERGRPIHVVASNNNQSKQTVVITAYEPDPSLWTDQFPMETNMEGRHAHMETSLTPGQPCRQCPEGTYRKGTVTETLERGDTTVVVKEVPALVCDTCKNSLLSAPEVKRLQSILRRAVDAGVTLESRSYQPAAQPL